MQSRRFVASSHGRCAARGRYRDRGSIEIRSAVACAVENLVHRARLTQTFVESLINSLSACVMPSWKKRLRRGDRSRRSRWSCAYFENLEVRLALSSYTWNASAGTLLIDLGTNDQMTVAEAGGTRTFHLTTGGTFAASGGNNATGNGTSTITFSAANNIGTSITVNNIGDASPSNESVTFLGGNLTSGAIAVDLTRTTGTSSAISFTTATSNFSSSAVTLQSATNISCGAGGSISTATGTLSLSSATGIGSSTSPLQTAVADLALRNSTSGSVVIANSGALTLTAEGTLNGTVGNELGNFAPGGTTSLSASGPVTYAINFTSHGDLSTTTSENSTETSTPLPPPDENITVNSGVTLESTGGNVNLSSADSLLVRGTAVSDNGAISLSMGQGDVDNDAALILNGTLSAPTVRYTTPGDIFMDDLPAALTNRSGQTVAIISTNGGIFDNTAPDGASDDTDVTAANLALSAATGIGTSTDPLETVVAHLAVHNTTSGSVCIANSGALTLTAVDTLNGTTGNQVGNLAPGGATILSASGPVTYAINFTSQGDLSTTTSEKSTETTTPLPPPDENITINSGVTVESTGGNVSLSSADSLAVQGTVVSSGGAISLSIGQGDVDNDATLILNGTLTAPTVRYITPGDIFMDDLPAALTNRSGQTVAIISTNGGIFDNTAPDGASDDTDVTAANLALSATTGIGTSTDPLETVVAHLAVHNTTSGKVCVANSGALTLTAVDTLNGTAGNQLGNFASGGTTSFSASGPVTYAINFTSQGDLSTTTSETATETSTPLPPPDENITVSSAVTVQSTGGNVSLTSADSILVQGTVVSSSGAISLLIGQGDVDDDAALFLSGALAGQTVQFTTPGNVFFDSLPSALTNRSGQTLAITSTNGGIFDDSTPDGALDDTDVTAANLALSAATGIGTASDPIETVVSNVSAQTGTGGIFLANSGSLTIGSVGFVSGLTASNAPISVSTSGSLTINSPINAGSAGSITLTPTGGDVIDAAAGALTGASITQSTGTTLSMYRGLVTAGNGGVNLMGSVFWLQGNFNLTHGSLALSDTGDSTLTGTVSVSGGVIKNGVGSLSINTAQSYAGATVVNAGTLNVNNALAPSGLVQLNGGVLGGVGSLGSLMASGGTVKPGLAGPGILTAMGAVTLTSASTLQISLDGSVAGTGYSQLVDNSTATVNLGSATLSASLGYSPSPTDALEIVHQIGGGAVTGTFAQGNSINVGGQLFNIDYGVDSSGDGAVTLTPAPPVIQSVVINDGSAQRSMVDSITIGFNEAITFNASAFELDTVDPNTGISTPVTATVTPILSSDGMSVTLTFSGSGIINRSLADGDYVLTVHGSGVQNRAGQALASDAVTHFHRLFGDIDGDGRVTAADLIVWRSALNQTPTTSNYVWYLDFNGINGDDRNDYNQALARYLSRVSFTY